MCSWWNSTSDYTKREGKVSQVAIRQLTLDGPEEIFMVVYLYLRRLQLILYVISHEILYV